MAAAAPTLRLSVTARVVFPALIMRSHMIDVIISSRTIANDVRTATFASRALTLVSVSVLTTYLLPTAVKVAVITSDARTEISRGGMKYPSMQMSAQTMKPMK